MNLGILGATLLAQVVFGWNTPPPEEQVTKVEIRVANSIAEHDNGIVYDAGFPPVVDNRQSFQRLIDISTPKYAWLGFRNSFGVQEGPPMRLGKPSIPTGTTATIAP